MGFTRPLTRPLTRSLTRPLVGRKYSGPTSAFDPAFKMTVDTTQAGSASDTFILPARDLGTYSATVDWGDGSTSEITTYNDADLSHTYSTSGTYQVSITGTFPAIYFNNGGDKNKLISIDQWGDLGWISMLSSFYNCSNLSLSSGSITGADEVTDFSNTFRGTPLTSLPTGLFDNCSKAENFSFCFRDCLSLSSLPTGLFDNCPEATSFIFAFRAAPLTTLPAGLFHNNTKATNFAACFLGCGLTSADPTMFEFCTLAADFTNCFSGCTLNTDDYSNMLINLEANNQNNTVPFHGGNSTYNASGATARAALIADHTWSITDGGAA